MPIRSPNLPPFNTLIALECVQRHGSFAGAARELNVSQAAISHKICELEDWLGMDLFLRAPQGVTPVEDVHFLAETIRSCFDQLATPLSTIKSKGHDGSQISLACVNAFAVHWLMPRMQSFYAVHSDINLTFLVSDREIRRGQSNFDVGITFTAQQWDGFEELVLFTDEVIAIASPSYVAKRGDRKTGPVDNNDSFLHLSNPEPSWLTWEKWGESCCHSLDFSRNQTTYSNDLTVLQAAKDGLGIAMGWKAVVQPMIDRGEVQQLGSQFVVPPGCYKLLIRRMPDNQKRHSVRAFTNWIKQSATDHISEFNIGSKAKPKPNV